MSEHLATATACGKIILFGEHAVVYQQPAIAVPLSVMQVEAKAFRAPAGQGITIYLPDFSREFRFMPDDRITDNGLTYTVRLVLEKLNASVPDVDIYLESNIPQKAGFGSGAAVSTALARLLSMVLDRALPTADLNALVFEVEKMHHGTPSGIDNTVITHEKPLYFIKGKPNLFLDIALPFSLLVARMPHSTPTKVTVSDVRFLYEKHPRRVMKLFINIGEIVQQARYAIETGELADLGPLMNENHRLLRRLTVSDGPTDKLWRAALRAGALGAKLSGGGRGGNLIALVTPDVLGSVSDALLKNGATALFKAEIS
jgi:mevalonate kinase